MNLHGLLGGREAIASHLQTRQKGCVVMRHPPDRVEHCRLEPGPVVVHQVSLTRICMPSKRPEYGVVVQYAIAMS
jgi:hypothetical protein